MCKRGLYLPRRGGCQVSGLTRDFLRRASRAAAGASCCRVNHQNPRCATSAMPPSAEPVRQPSPLGIVGGPVVIIAHS